MKESKKRWKYKMYSNISYPLGNEPFVIARTKEEAKKLIKKAEGKYPVELWWKNLA